MTASGPLAGIRVLEIANWIMTPAAAGVLATFGADVIKVEPAGSADPMRRLNTAAKTLDASFELANNRKRAIQLDLGNSAAQEVIHRILAESDILLTNVRADSLARAGLDPETLVVRFPQLIVAHGTGYGRFGPTANRPAFDELAYWARGGIATALQVEGQPPVSLVGALGDLPSAIAMVAGVSMALYRREREGRGGIIDVSLYHCGLWANGAALAGPLAGVPAREKRGRDMAFSPLYTSYQCADGTWVQFAMLPPMRYWPVVCKVLDRPDLLEDERFATSESLALHSREAIAELERTIADIARPDLARLLDDADLPWSEVFELDDVVADEQARMNGYIRRKHHRSGIEMGTLTPPFSLRDQEPLMEPAPELGQHTEEVLLELGYRWDEISALRERGAY